MATPMPATVSNRPTGAAHRGTCRRLLAAIERSLCGRHTRRGTDIRRLAAVDLADDRGEHIGSGLHRLACLGARVSDRLRDVVRGHALEHVGVERAALLHPFAAEVDERVRAAAEVLEEGVLRIGEALERLAGAVLVLYADEVDVLARVARAVE